MAPVSRMKMTFLAVFFVAMFCDTIPDGGAEADWPIRYEPPRPIPAAAPAPAT